MSRIFGSELGTGTSQDQTLPLGILLAGVTLVVAGQPMPLPFASDGQVNALLPFATPLNTRLQVIASNGSQISFLEEISVAAAQPGVFTVDGTGKNQGHMYITAADGSSQLAGSSSPAKAGDEIVIYCSGLGPVNVPVADGTASPFASDSLCREHAECKHRGSERTGRFRGIDAWVRRSVPDQCRPRGPIWQAALVCSIEMGP